MRVAVFVEGPRQSRGGIGIPAAVSIGQALANRGHTAKILVVGKNYPNAEKFVRENGNLVLTQSLEVFVAGPAFGSWVFAPTLPVLASNLIRETDIVLLHSLYSSPVAVGYALARLYRKPYCIWLHGVLAPFQRPFGVRKKRIYDPLIANRILRDASVIVYTAAGEREETRDLKLSAPSVIIPHGVDISEYRSLPPRGRFRARYLGGHEGRLVLFLGRLNAKKGLDLLFEAMARVREQMPDVRLAVVGGSDPPAFGNQVRGWLREHGLEDYTVLPGLLTGMDKLAAFADSDVFVLPSHAENFAHAMFEAMASRLPVVVSDTMNLAAEVERFNVGIVVKRNPQDLAKAISELLKDEVRRQHMGENGFRLAQSYSWERNAEMVERTMECIVQGTPLPTELTQL